MLTTWPYFWKPFQKVSRSNQILLYSKDSVEISLRVFQLIFFARSLPKLARLQAVKIPATSSVRCICIRIISVKWLVIDGTTALSSNRIRTDSLLPHSDANNALSINSNQSRVGSALEIFLYLRRTTRSSINISRDNLNRSDVICQSYLLTAE